MKKPVLAIDIDEVLMPHFGDLISWYNQEFGTQLTLYDNHPTDPGNWGTNSIEEAVRRVHHFYDTQEFLSSKPYVETRGVLARLGVDYELIVVTARDALLEEITLHWLEEHFSEVFSQVHFTKHFNLDGKRRDKVEVLLEEGVRYFIDDSISNVDLAAAAGIDCVLFGDYPWNQIDELPVGMTRCRNWAEVAEYFGV